MKEWEEDNKQIVSSFWFVVNTKYRYAVIKYSTVKEVFESMEEIFLKEEKMQKLTFKEKYNIFKFDEKNKNINAQFLRYEELMKKCIELRVKIEENEDKYEYLYIAMS
jgi:hypothetical protein